MHRLRVGDVEVVSLYDTRFPTDPNELWPGAGAALDAYHDRLEPTGEIVLDSLSFLLRIDGQTVLIDTGMGPEDPNSQLLVELDRAGVQPGDIDVIVYTHLHSDHTGWNLDRATGQPLFPRARYLVSKRDWEANRAAPQEPSFDRDIVPLEGLGRLELIEGSHQVTPSLQAVDTAGHTPGHLAYVFTSGDQRAAFIGDIVLTSVDVEQPDWQNMYDSDHEEARVRRRAVLDDLASDGAVVCPAHLRSPGFGHVTKVDGRLVWQPIEA